MIIGHIEISSFRGISIGAVHWYARFHVEDKNKDIEDVRLERPYSAKEISTLNAEAKAQGYLARQYVTGQMTDGFNTEASAIRKGITIFKKKYPEGILFKGDVASFSGWKNVIYYPEKYANHVTALELFATEFQKLNGYECQPHLKKIVELLDKSWYNIYIKLINT